MTVSWLGELLEPVGRGNWRYPAVTQFRVVLPSGWREVWIHEVPDCDPDHRAARAPFHGPVDGRTTGRAEVVAGRDIGEAGDTVDFQSVVDLGFALDLEALI